MQYTFENTPRSIRIALFAILLTSVALLALTNNFSGAAAGLTGGLLAGLSLGELGLYLKKRATNHTT